MRIHRVVAVFILIFSFTSSVYARHHAAPTMPTVEIEGVLKTVMTTSLVITTEHNNDVTVNITPTTIFRSEDMAIDPATLKAGDRVEVKAVKQGTALNAVVVRVDEQEQQEPQLVEINGVIKTVATNQIVVTDAQMHDITIAIAPTTLIRKNGQPATVGDLKIGDRVEVRAMVSGTTTTAVFINDETEQPENEEAEVEGIVKSVGTNSITVTTAGGDVVVNVDTNTRMHEDDRTITLADIKVGDRVEAQGTRVDAHTILAAQIEVESSGHD